MSAYYAIELCNELLTEQICKDDPSQPQWHQELKSLLIKTITNDKKTNEQNNNTDFITNSYLIIS